MRRHRIIGRIVLAATLLGGCESLVLEEEPEELDTWVESVTPTSVTMAVGEATTIEVRTSGDLQPVFGPSATSDNSAVATADVSTDSDNDHVRTAVITGHSVGQAQITFSYPEDNSGHTAPSVEVNVVAEAMVPTSEELSGQYTFTVTRTTDTCAAGFFPESLLVQNLQVQVIGTGQTPPVAIASIADVVGLFDTVTGAYEGSGSGILAIAQSTYPIVELIDGVWSITTNTQTSQSTVRLDAEWTFTITRQTGPCTVGFDASFTRTFNVGG